VEREKASSWAGMVPIDACVDCSSEMKKMLEGFIKFVVVGSSHRIQCVMRALTV
jgi:hypothetical protein